MGWYVNTVEGEGAGCTKYEEWMSQKLKVLPTFSQMLLQLSSKRSNIFFDFMKISFVVRNFIHVSDAEIR